MPKTKKTAKKSTAKKTTAKKSKLPPYPLETFRHELKTGNFHTAKGARIAVSRARNAGRMSEKEAELAARAIRKAFGE
jgi:hypothetical protein